MSNLEETTNIVSKYGRDGIRFLILFKILQPLITLELKKKKIPFSDEQLGKVCVDITNRLSSLNKTHPSETEIKRLLCKIRDEYSEK